MDLNWPLRTFFYSLNGHRLELACPDPDETAMLARLDGVKWEMLEEWSRTKRAPRHAAFLHERQFSQAVEAPGS